jgi:hypothetical protein
MEVPLAVICVRVSWLAFERYPSSSIFLLNGNIYTRICILLTPYTLLFT